MGLTRRTGGFPTMEFSSGLIRKLSSYFIRLPANLSARVYLDGGYEHTTGAGLTLAYETVEFDTERWDTGTNDTYANGIWDAANPERLTAVKHGFWVVSAHVYWEANVTGDRGILIVLQPGKTSIASSETRASANANQGLALSVSTIVLLNEGDYVEMQLAQTSGGNLSTGGASADAWDLCDFAMARIP